MKIPENVIGQPMSYKKLCQALDITPKSGKSKIYQLKDLALYCDIQHLSNPTRYIINEIYDQALLPTKAKFQAPIEILMMELFKANGYQTLYLANSRLLEYMKLVNSNYRVLKNPKLRKKLPNETQDLYQGASKSGEILMKWLNRALDRMEGIYLLRRKGYCLVKKDGEFTHVINVPLDSKVEQKIIECQRQAYIKLGLIYDSQHQWIPQGMKAQYQAQFDREVYMAFDGEYVGAFQVNVLTPNTKGIKEILTVYESEKIVNEEAQRKIKETKELNYLTGEVRERIVEEIIKKNLSIDYNNLINN